MSVSTETVQQIAQLSMLSIDQSSIETVTSRINKVLSLVETLQAVDTSGVVPLAHPLDAVQTLRDDNPASCQNRDKLLANAPEQHDGQLAVVVSVSLLLARLDSILEQNS